MPRGPVRRRHAVWHRRRLLRVPSAIPIVVSGALDAPYYTFNGGAPQTLGVGKTYVRRRRREPLHPFRIAGEDGGLPITITVKERYAYEYLRGALLDEGDVHDLGRPGSEEDLEPAEENGNEDMRHAREQRGVQDAGGYRPPRQVASVRAAGGDLLGQVVLRRLQLARCRRCRRLRRCARLTSVRGCAGGPEPTRMNPLPGGPRPRPASPPASLCANTAGGSRTPRREDCVRAWPAPPAPLAKWADRSRPGGGGAPLPPSGYWRRRRRPGLDLAAGRCTPGECAGPRGDRRGLPGVATSRG